MDPALAPPPGACSKACGGVREPLKWAVLAVLPRAASGHRRLETQARFETTGRSECQQLRQILQ